MMLRDFALHLVFWAPSGTTLDPAIEPGMKQMESDIQRALAAGQNGNIFSVPGEYTDAAGPGDPRIASVDSTDDSTPAPASQTGTACQNAPGPCVTTTQLDQEVDSLGAQKGWTPGVHTLVLVILASPVAVCSPQACEFGCGYHSLTAASYTDAIVVLSATLYGCGGQPDLSYAEELTGHEQNEAIVDPPGTGIEIADPCVGQFAANEINGHEYVVPYLQLPSGACSAVAVFTPVLDARFSVPQAPVAGGTAVTFTPAKDEDPGGQLIHDQWYYIAATPIEAGGYPITHVFKTSPGVTYLVSHLLQDLSGASAQSSLGFSPGPSAGQVSSALGHEIMPSGKAGRIGQVLKHRGYSLSFIAPCPGRLVIRWYRATRGKHLMPVSTASLIATASVVIQTAGRAKIELKLTANGRKLLSAARRLTLTAAGTFTPSGEPAISATKTITLKQ